MTAMDAQAVRDDVDADHAAALGEVEKLLDLLGREDHVAAEVRYQFRKTEKALTTYAMALEAYDRFRRKQRSHA